MTKLRRYVAMLMVIVMLFVFNGSALSSEIENNPIQNPGQTETLPEAPAEEPTETPTEEPTEEPVEEPTEEPVETPTEEPVETPTEEPVETPTEEPVETPTEEPVETPTEEPIVPEITVDDVQNEASVQTAAEEAETRTITFYLYIEGGKRDTPVRWADFMISNENGETVTYGRTNENGYGAVELPAGTYFITASTTSNRYVYTAEQEFTVGNRNTTVNVELKMPTGNSAEAIYDRTSYFDHVDIRVKGTYSTGTANELQTYNIALKNAKITVTNNGENNFTADFSRQTGESYEWRKTGVRVSKEAVITLTCEIYYANDSTKTTIDTYTTSFSGKADFVKAIEQCDGRQGLDFIINPVEIIEALRYTVDYQWEVVSEDAALAAELEALLNSYATPPSPEAYDEGDIHNIDTAWHDGTHLILQASDGEYYRLHFEGWSQWKEDSETDWDHLGDTTSITMDNDYDVYGHWVIEKLAQILGYGTLTKTFEGIGKDDIVLMSRYFTVTEPDGTTDDVDFTEMEWVGDTLTLTYEFPLTSDGTYTITEMNAEMPGYTLAGTTASANANTAAVVALDVDGGQSVVGGKFEVTANTGTSITVDLELPSGDADEIHMGAISFTNTYTRNESETEQHEYPALVIDKIDYETEALLPDAVFTLTGENYSQTATTDMSGYAAFRSLQPGTYYLTETEAPEGYELGYAQHKIVVEEQNGSPFSELIGDEWVKVHRYEITAYISTDGGASWTESQHFSADRNRLEVFNWRIPAGDLVIQKSFAGVTENQTAGLEIELTVTGPDNFSETVILTAENEWTASLVDVTPGAYTVTENTATAQIPGYTLNTEYVTVDVAAHEVKTAVVVNTYAQNIVTIEGTKTWVDNDDQDGIRPLSITVNLLANGEVIDSAEVSGGTGWEYYFTDLPEYEGSEKITYTVEEVPVDGYTASYDGNTITNTHIPATTTVTVNKLWNDADDQDGIRPGSVTVYVKNGDEVVDTLTLTAPDWTATSKELPKNAEGVEIVYTIEEAAVEGYTASYNGNTITNTRTPDTTTVTVNKLWNDADNQDGIRPGSVTVYVKNDDEVVDTLTLTAPAWTATSKELPKNAAGVEIVYTIEEAAVEGYTASYNGNTITNTHTPSTVNIEGGKSWLDNDDQDGKRPDSITVNLLKNGVEIDEMTVTAADGWKWSFTSLPEYEAGAKIVYTIAEDEVEGYSTKVEGYDVINSYTPGVANIEGGKTWNDADDQDGIRPDSITVNLLANGEVADTVTVTAENGWKWSFTDLPEYEAGEKITYTITEDAVEGYTASVNGWNITNTHAPETTYVDGYKTWDDAYDQDGIRPAGIIVNLLANGIEVAEMNVSAETGWQWRFDDLPKYEAGVEIVYTVTEDPVEGYTTSVNGQTIINTHTPETVAIAGEKVWNLNGHAVELPEAVTINLYADGEPVASVTPSAAEDWKWSFGELAKFENGEEIIYTVDETSIDDFSSAITGSVEDGFTVTNTYAPKLGDLVIAKVEHFWRDGSEILTAPDGRGGSSYLFNVTIGDTVHENVLIKAGSSVVFENIEYGTPYTVEEIFTVDAVFHCEIENASGVIGNEVARVTAHNHYYYTSDNEGFVALKKDAETGRPVAGAGFTLYADKDCTVKVASAVSGADGVVHLPINEEGTFYLKETSAPAGYHASDRVYVITAEYQFEIITDASGRKVIHQQLVIRSDDLSVEQDNGLTIVYAIENVPVKELGVSVQKVWNDGGYLAGRPESVEIALLKDGEIYETVLLNADNGWFYNWSDLTDLNTWTVDELNVPADYTAQISNNGDAWTVTNSRETVTIEGEKVWNLSGCEAALPESVTIHLQANGETVATTTATAANGWAFSFGTLPATVDGKPVEYTVTEDAVAGYASAITGGVAEGFTVTNTLETVTIEGEKVWNLSGCEVDLPESITIHLLANGEIVATTTATAANGWTWSFGAVPATVNGKPVEYTVTEDAVAGYASAITGSVAEGFTVTNTLETVTIEGEKVWNLSGFAVELPESITIHLLANGETVATTTATAANGWAFSFGVLPAAVNGVPVEYTITEDAVAGFVPTVTGDALTGFVLTNTYDPELGSLTISKTVKGGGSKTKAFSFTLTITGMEGTLSCTGAVNATFDASQPFTFTLAHGQSVTINGILAGAQYTVTEAAYSDYTASVTNGAGTIAADETISVEFINTFDADDEEDDTVPKTGDSGNAAAMPVLASLAMMWLCVGFYVAKRKLVAR